MSCSLRKWFNDLPWMQQGVLLGAIRNCDGYRSEGHHKVLARGIRAACIKAAQTEGSFNARRPDPNILLDAAHQFTDKHFDHMPVHFVTHLMHAAEVIGYGHPDEVIATLWDQIYRTIADAMHLNVETYAQFTQRLKDDPEQVERENQYDEKCFEMNEYGNNTGVINEGDKA